MRRLKIRVSMLKPEAVSARQRVEERLKSNLVPVIDML